jgi:DNA transformation protein
MAKLASEFVEFLTEVFESFGPINAKRMFGGYGIYRDGLMFGLVADDVLYLKADAKSVAKFTDRGLPCFEYLKQGKRMRISYYAAPDEVFDNPDEARDWAMLAFEAALRGRKTH